MDFSKNPLLDPQNSRWQTPDVLKIEGASRNGIDKMGKERGEG